MLSASYHIRRETTTISEVLQSCSLWHLDVRDQVICSQRDIQSRIPTRGFKIRAYRSSKLSPAEPVVLIRY